MTRLPPPAFGAGPLFFPLTPFDGRDRVDPAVLADHVRTAMAHDPGGVFAACGTGELHALSVDEHAEVVGTTVGVVGGAVPVFAGVGGALGTVRQQLASAEEAGADGILLLPPYLVASPAAGLVAWVRAVADATRLPVIVYQRANAVLPPESVAEVAAIPNVVGVKDGVGDLEAVARTVHAVRAAVGPDTAFFNGMPTAELSAPAYRAAGVARYSSAVFCFAPALSAAYCAALDSGDAATVERLLGSFFAPLVALRNEVPGYAVSLVKAAARLTGQAVGPVRPPLVDPGEDHLRRLRDLLQVAADLGYPPAGR